MSGLLCWMLGLLPGAQATDLESVLVGRLSLGGDFYAGNLSQTSLRTSGYLGWNTPTWGNDLLLSGFRLWLQLDESSGFTRIGDDLSLVDVPFRYLTEHHYVHALLRYEHSQLHQVDHRVMAGMGAGWTPFRQQELLLRGSLGAYVDHSRYPGDEFRIQVEHDGSQRTVPRVGVLSNGWWRQEGAPLSLRYVAWALVNPLQAEDLRLMLDASMDLHLSESVALQASLLGRWDPVVLDGVVPYDLRATFGVSVSGRSALDSEP